MTETETLLVRSPSSTVVHVGKRGKFAGTVVTACNGRTMAGYVLADGAVTCKRCAKTFATPALAQAEAMLAAALEHECSFVDLRPAPDGVAAFCEECGAEQEYDLS